MQTANESGLCPVCGQHFDSTAHMASCSTYVGEPKKKTELETFEARANTIKTHHGLPNLIEHEDAIDLCREADQHIERLTKERDTLQEAWEGCTESAPLELVEVAEALIEELNASVPVYIPAAGSYGCRACERPMVSISKNGHHENCSIGNRIKRAQATIERWKV